MLGPKVQRDPRVRARPGTYLENGERLVYVLEADHSGAIVEDCATDVLLELEPVEILQRWRPVTPEKEAV